MSKKRQET
uniref:Uncharacterized protein n=1 Tax=Rhizophora mucronata TaxID=61149 RepID=A0A2P2NK00_RHIMU